MQYIDQDKLSLISPMHIVTGVRASYYSLSPIMEGDILFVKGETGTTLWRAGRTSCVKRRRGIIIGGTPNKPILARYTVQTYLQEITEGPEHDHLVKEMEEMEALPF